MKVSFLIVLCYIVQLTQSQNTDVDNIVALPHGGGRWNTELNTSVEWELVMNSNSDPMLKFTLQGADTGYVSVALSEDTLMGVADDCYYCSRTYINSTEINITSAYLTGHGRPTIVEQVSTNFISAAIADGMITCSFYRPISVEKNVSGTVTTWNASLTSYNLLYAEGRVRDDASLRYHQGQRTWTNGTFSLLNNTGYIPNPTTAPVTTTSSATIVSSTVVYIFAAIIFSMY